MTGDITILHSGVIRACARHTSRGRSPQDIATAVEIFEIFFVDAAFQGSPRSIVSDDVAINTATERDAKPELEIELAMPAITFKHDTPNHLQTYGTSATT